MRFITLSGGFLICGCAENMLASLETAVFGMKKENRGQMLSRSLNPPHLEAGKEAVTCFHFSSIFKAEAKPKGAQTSF